MRDYDPLGFTEEEHEEMLEMMRKKFEKALKEDPFYKPKAKKKGAKEPKKKHQGYNWTTTKKMNRGQRDKIKSLKAKGELTDQEQVTLKRMTQLYKWSSWALKMHKEGKSDRSIHAETQKRKTKKTRT
jgi:hypothetical protein